MTRLYSKLASIRPRHLLISLIGFLVSLFLLTSALFWYSSKELYANSVLVANEMVADIDEMFNEIEKTATISLGFAGQPCNDVLRKLKEYAALPSIRTIALTKNHIFYCSSLFGVFNEVDLTEQKDDTIWLLSGNLLTPSKSLLGYYKYKGDGELGTLVSVDGKFIANILSGERNSTLLVINNAWMDSKSVVYHLPVNYPETAVAEQSSTNFPFKIITGFAGSQWVYLFNQYFLLLIVSFIISAVIGMKLYQILPLHGIKRAIKAGEFIPYYQGIKSADDNSWYGVEVLVRWRHPKKGIILPDQFIPLIENSKLIIQLTRALIEHVKTDLLNNITTIPKHFHISFNISPQHLKDTTLAHDCSKFLQSLPAQHINLTLELTERELVETTQTSILLFKLLQDIDIKISIDDFGTGYANLAYLKHFNADFLKIDRSFVKNLVHNSRSQHIVGSIIDLASKLNIGIIAEGVETEAQHAYLLQHGVSLLQGFLFSKPAPINELIELIIQRD